MKTYLYMCAAAVVVVGAGCCSERQAYKQTTTPNIIGQVWETGRPEGARVDWNEPWRIEQLAQGGAPAAGHQVAAESQARAEAREGEILLHQEELVVGKREVSNGGVLIRKVVQTENVSQPIELRREEYVIERVPVVRSGGTVAAGELAFQPQEIYVPLTREEAVTSKRAWITERVQLGKKIETDRKTITQPVRKEDVQIVKNPSRTPRGQTAMAPAIPGNVGQGGTATQAGVVVASESSTQTLQLAKEEFMVGKREVENGSVQLKKVISTQDASQNVDLRREEFAIERSPVQDTPAANPDFQSKEIRISLTREEPVVGTRAFVIEKIRVRKAIETDKQTVSGSIRKESLEVLKETAGVR